MHFTCNQHCIKNTVTKKHKNNYCKKKPKAKPSLKRRLDSVHLFYFFTSYLLFLRLRHGSILRQKWSFDGQAPALPTVWRKAGVSACLVGLWHWGLTWLLWKGRQRRLLCTSCGGKSAAAFMCCTGFRHPAVYYKVLSKTWRAALWYKNTGISQPESQLGFFTCERGTYLPRGLFLQLLICLTLQSKMWVPRTLRIWGYLKYRLIEPCVDFR